MSVIGREPEIKVLNELLSSKESEMLAIYGRRRVGKTYLIREMYQQQIIFDCTGLYEQPLNVQLQNFWNTLVRSAKHHSRSDPPGTWLQAFEFLQVYVASLRGKGKKVIFLDELPWFDTPRSGFLSALGNFWNSWAVKRKDIIIVICGSAASWMIKKIINQRGGLHNRVTRRLRLLPFTLKETKAYLQSNRVNLQDYDILQLYMAIGGIPYYLKFVKRGKSVAQIIEFLFFDKNGPLRNEFENLYASLFKHYTIHVGIIRALASKHRGLTRNEILGFSGVASGGAFSEYLFELEESGFIQSQSPFLNIRKEVTYRLSDEFSLFYLTFLQKRRKSSGWVALATHQSYKIWCGHAFENVCLKHTEQIKRDLGISGIHTEESSWVLKGTKNQDGIQIDLVIDRADQCINLCEMKFYSGIFEINKSYSEILRKKMNLFQQNTKTRKNLFLTMITTYGVKPNANMLNLVSHSVEIGALFK
ncbi:MAG: ATP-binding protein [Bacteroidota bacterium]|nr:ATP-binding protein [Bacteroidota bacterium]